MGFWSLSWNMPTIQHFLKKDLCQYLHDLWCCLRKGNMTADRFFNSDQNIDHRIKTEFRNHWLLLSFGEHNKLSFSTNAPKTLPLSSTTDASSVGYNYLETGQCVLRDLIGWSKPVMTMRTAINIREVVLLTAILQEQPKLNQVTTATSDGGDVSDISLLATRTRQITLSVSFSYSPTASDLCLSHFPSLMRYSLELITLSEFFFSHLYSCFLNQYSNIKASK